MLVSNIAWATCAVASPILAMTTFLPAQSNLPQKSKQVYLLSSVFLTSTTHPLKL